MVDPRGASEHVGRVAVRRGSRARRHRDRRVVGGGLRLGRLARQRVLRLYLAEVLRRGDVLKQLDDLVGGKQCAVSSKQRAAGSRQ